MDTHDSDAHAAGSLEARISGLLPGLMVLYSYETDDRYPTILIWAAVAIMTSSTGGLAFHERSTDLQFVELHVLERVEALLEHFHK